MNKGFHYDIIIIGDLSAPNALNIVWWPGSARTRWRSLQRSPDPLAGFKGPTSKARKGRTGKGRERRGEGRAESADRRGNCVIGLGGGRS